MSEVLLAVAALHMRAVGFFDLLPVLWDAEGMPDGLEQIKKTVTPLLEENDVSFAAVFGSHARGEAGPESDIDLVVRFAKPKSLFDLVRLERSLAEAMRKKVDLLTEKSISPYLKDRILRESIVLYGTR